LFFLSLLCSFPFVFVQQSQYLRKEEPARLQTAKHLEMLMQHARRADPNAGSREQYLEMISQALLLRVAQLRMRDGVEAPVSGFETLSVQPTDKDEVRQLLMSSCIIGPTLFSSSAPLLKL